VDSYYIPIDKILDFAIKISENSALFYPVIDNNRAFFTRFEKDKEFKPDFTKIRSAHNIKHFFFPDRDQVARFPNDREPRSSPQVLMGVKACDLRGIEVYDRVFLKAEPIDPQYQQARDMTILIAADCPEPEPTCFCNLLNINPFDDRLADITMTLLGRGYLFQALSERGQAFLAKTLSLFSSPSEDDFKRRNDIRSRAIGILSKINPNPLPAKFESRLEKVQVQKMREARADCVECFACLHACPTCYCFLLSDYRQGKDTERVRSWDACYYGAYARVGGGANPRGRFDKRFWNRFLCKFSYFLDYEKMHACSGCGRCFSGCSAHIDIRKILAQS